MVNDAKVGASENCMKIEIASARKQHSSPCSERGGAVASELT